MTQVQRRRLFPRATLARHQRPGPIRARQPQARIHRRCRQTLTHRLSELPTTARSMMTTTAQEMMSRGIECIRETETVVAAAERMAQLDVGALPICDRHSQLTGMLTDRDIVVKVLASGRDPCRTQVSELASGKPVTIGADAPAEEVLRTMSMHQIKRLPVLEADRIIGLISQRDVAGTLRREQIGGLVQAIST